MTQQLTITTDASIELRPLIEAAIQSELRLLKLGLERTSQRLRLFEEKYNLTSEEFQRRFETGQIAESLDFIEWFGEIKTYHLLEAQQQTLKGVQLN